MGVKVIIGKGFVRISRKVPTKNSKNILIMERKQP
jgi:hypothetical protein